MKHARKDYDRIQDPALKNRKKYKNVVHPIEEDEPVFLLRAKDPVAYKAVLYWANEAGKVGASSEIIDAARKQANLMKQWEPKNTRPDLPEEKTDLDVQIPEDIDPIDSPEISDDE